MPEDQEPKTKEEKLLKEIRDRYHYAMNYWDDIRQEAATDMRYISGDPWDSEAKGDRDDAGRPYLSLDELNQYLNQAENNIRQNPRGIKIEPAGEGATDDSAEFEQGLIRDIEYASSAQRNAYAPAFMSALERSYGFFMIRRRYIGKSWNQEIYLEGITDPDTILFDPDVQKADWSDADFFFIAKPMRKEEFKKKYPKAKVQDFTKINFGVATKDWIRKDHVVVAEYWRVVSETTKLYLIDTPEGPTSILESELPANFDRSKLEDAKQRDYEIKSIEQYITNGVEILEEHPDQIGEILPCVPVLGKELWINNGSGSERELHSLVRMARDPQMLFNYYCTQEAEEAQKCPLTPFVGAKGQFESNKAAWGSLNVQPVAYVEYDLILGSDGQPLQGVAPPTRPQFIPNFQQYELAKDSCRRSIQAAMGISPLPTAAQRNNEKSGIALERIETTEQIGSFHFTDNFDRALELAGRIIESWIPVVYDTEREVAIRSADGKHRVVKINTEEPVQDGQDQYHYKVGGKHRTSVSTGPSFRDQREASADFLDKLLQTIPNLPISPAQQAQLLALGIKMRELGPLGDKMAAIVEGDPNAQGQQAIQQLQQQQELVQEMQKELQQLRLEKQGKVIDNQFKLEIEKLRTGADNWQAQLSNDIKVLTALITAKRGQEDQEAEMYKTFWMENHKAAHETALSAQEHGQALAQGAQAAALTPQPEPTQQQA